MEEGEIIEEFTECIAESPRIYSLENVRRV